MDQTQPLLLCRSNEEYRTVSQPLVDFDPDGDPDNPLDWSKSYRMGIVLLLGLMAFTVTFTCNGLVPIAEIIVLELDGRESKSAGILLVTVWELGEAAGPLFIAPLSEIFGRYPVFNIANLLFIFGVTLGALSHTTNLFIFSRFLTGFAVASNVLNPAIIGDIFPSETRGSPMSLIMLAPLMGGAIGPAIGAAIAEHFGWRKVLLMSAVLAILCEIAFFTLLRETYKVPILQRRAARLREETKDESLKCAWETENKGAAWKALRVSITRPVVVMLDSSVLQIMSLYGALFFTYFYILATTLPGILREFYDFSPTLTGLAFLPFSAGAAGGVFLCNRFLDRIYVSLGKSNGGIADPEHRLPFMIAASVAFPFIVALYGWAPYAGWSVYVMLLAVALLGFVMMMIMVPISSYVVDAFGLYSASAMTMVLIVRCLAGTLLPLAVPPLTDAFGLGYGFLFLAAVCFVLMPLPTLVFRYGWKWRQNSVYTKNE